MQQEFRFRINGLGTDARFYAQDTQDVLLPLLKRLTALQREKGRRICVFLAGPPAAGKSTLCAYLEQLSRRHEGLTPVQAVGIDGFHRYNSDLQSSFINRQGRRIALFQIKGAPETYDLSRLRAALAAIGQEGRKWPAYDRRIHDPVEDSISITAQILIVEGNWLLLDEAPWNTLECDYSVFLCACGESGPERIVRRKMLGGYSEEQARRMVCENDRPNIRRCMENSRRADLTIAYNEKGYMEGILL